MRNTSLKHVNEPEVVAGFFREALFHSRLVQITANGETFEGKIIEVVENSSRGLENQRKLRLACRPPKQFQETGKSAEAELKCFFPHFVARWTDTFEHSSGDTVTIPMPGSIAIHNERNSKRVPLAIAGNIKVPVVVSTNGKYAEALLEVEDHSKSGCGGILAVYPGFEVRVGTRLQGVSKSKPGRIRVDGEIVQAQLLDSTFGSDGETRYRVGIANKISSTEGRSIGDERRVAQRHDVSFPLTVVSPLSPNHGIDIVIENASVSGFFGHLRDKSDGMLLSVALTVNLQEDSMLAEVVAQDENSIRFQLVSGNADSRLKWLNKLTRFRPEISSKTGVGSEIIDLFCESGAFSSKFIAEQSCNARDIISGLAADQANSSWVHRWIERTDSGEIRGHSSAIRISDQLWHLGDIAGMRRATHKISKDFIPQFFKNFGDYCRSVQPCPRVVISWAEGHPYWRDFEQYLRTCGPSDSFSIATEYSRIYKTEISEASEWRLQRIRPDEFALIEDIQKDAGDSTLEKFMRAFDFSVESFGSPALAGLLSNAGIEFQRHYVLAQLGDNKILVILHSFPAGVCPQRSIEAPWVISISGTPLDGSAMHSLIAAVKIYGLKNGFQFPGVLIAKPNESGAPSATKKMIWTVGHPKILSFFDGEK